jgi:ketosteroid isomerase-like protein
MSNRQVVEKYFQFVDNEDYDALESLFASDAILHSAGGGERSGIKRIMSFYRNVFIKFPKHRDEPTRIIETADVIVVEIAFTGQSNTGVSVSFPAVDIFDFKDGKISSLSQWVDTAAIETMLRPS